jgi:hypothetical protein
VLSGLQRDRVPLIIRRGAGPRTLVKDEK